MIFDTHCHYNLEPLYADWQSHWQKAQQHGVQKSMVVGTDVKTSRRAIDIAHRDANLWATVAVHPGEMTPEMRSDDIELAVAELRKLLTIDRGKKILAVGETGLDYFHLARAGTLSDAAQRSVRALQHHSLSLHLQLATDFHLPLILHVRDVGEAAYWDVLRIMQTQHFTGKCVFHCASGPSEYISQALKFDAYVSFAANITYKNADHLREIALLVPQERILVETDAPFLPPQAFRGQRCEPWMITQTVEFLQHSLNIEPTALWQNAHDFFGVEKVE